MPDAPTPVSSPKKPSGLRLAELRVRTARQRRETAAAAERERIGQLSALPAGRPPNDARLVELSRELAAADAEVNAALVALAEERAAFAPSFARSTASAIREAAAEIVAGVACFGRAREALREVDRLAAREGQPRQHSIALPDLRPVEAAARKIVGSR